MRILRSRIPGFQSQVHKQQRSAERNCIRLIVIPYTSAYSYKAVHRKHNKYRLSVFSSFWLKARIRCTSFILIRISQFQCIMITSGHIPVQSAQNTLIVIRPMPDAPTGQKGRVRNQVLPMLRSGQNARSCRSADLVPKLRRAVPTS